MFIEKKTPNIKNLNKFCYKLSLNNLLSVLAHYNLEIRNIKLIPILKDSASDATILNISNIKEVIYIEINVFKIKVFSDLESKYQEYVRNNNNRAIGVLKDGIKILLYRHILRTRKLYLSTQNNFYIQSATTNTIDKIINYLYKLFSEDYCTIISYEKKLINIKRKHSLIGNDDVGIVFLGGYVPSFIYLIKVNIILLNKNNFVINKIKLQIEEFEKKIKNKLVKIELKISIENSKKDIKYIGGVGI